MEQRKKYSVLITEIGCCGAYCGTCRELANAHCKGCKLGYENGKRDIAKSKCKMKICCFRERKLETCADCPDYLQCELIMGFHDKSGYKYKKYKQSMDFIRENGYDRFLEVAANWKCPYGKLDMDK